MKHRQFELKPRYWQIKTGQQLIRELNQIISFGQFSNQVEIVSYPDQEPFRIKIFQLDPEGDILFSGTKRRGYEFLRIEIKFPNKFCLYTGGNKKNSVNCISERELKKKSKAELERILLTWLLRVS